MWIMAKTYAEKLAEIAALTERVKALDLQVLDLRIREQALVEAVAAERARSDITVDRLLGERGISPVTPTKSPTLEDLSSMFEEDPTAVRNIQADIKERGAESVLLEAE